MTALARARQSAQLVFTYRQFMLAVTRIAFKGGAAGIDLSTGKVEDAHAEGDLLIIGRFDEDKDATSAEAYVKVNMGRQVVCDWWENGSTILVTDIGKLCYFADDQTVTLTPAAGGAPVAGRIWAVDTTLGVAVEKLAVSDASAPHAVGVLPGQVSNDMILPLASVIGGAVYDVPTTAAASTVTLPAAAPEGTKITFVADGTKNGHTVTYRDATGPASLTTALTASKRHAVECTYLGAKWFANAYVSP